MLSFWAPLSAECQTAGDSLTRELNRMYSRSDLPGFCVVIVNKDSVLYENGFGYADLTAKTPFTSHTLENIGSVSKLFIAVSIMKGIDSGYFDLETNINDVLPFAVGNPYFNDSIKLRHLVNHTSTIRDVRRKYVRSYVLTGNNTHYPFLKYFLLSLYTRNRSAHTLKDFLYAYCNDRGAWYSKRNFVKRRPGEAYSYSNIAASLAAYMIEVKSKMSFADYCTKYVLEPLGMKHSTWFKSTDSAALNATLYDHHNHAYPDYSLITYPEGGLHSSGQDLSTFLMEMMRGCYGESRLLHKEGFQQMFAPAFQASRYPSNVDTVNEANRGVFWILYNDGRIGHDGNDPGVSTYVYFYPAKGLGYVFMTNKMDNNSRLFEQDQRILETLERFGPMLNGVR
jgi:CubicO group peptidase (beta-lactamase class C family)